MSASRISPESNAFTTKGIDILDATITLAAVITVPMVEIKRRASWSMFRLGEKHVPLVMLTHIDYIGN